MSNATSHAALVASLSPEVLALLAASYGKPAEQVVERAARAPKASAPSKLRAVKAAAVEAEESGAQAAPVNRAPVTLVALPKVGTHNARQFLIAMRGAKTRDESIQAIAGYCGFDRHGDYGSQELAARMQAQREIRGVSALPRPVNSAAPTLAGYVSGKPDPMATKVADLLGRERLAAEALGEHDKIASDETVDAPTRSYHAQLSIVETARLTQIRADLAAMGIEISK